MSHTPEPWQYAEHGLRIINGEPTPDWSAEDVQRAVESVNATQGMADPAKEIAGMKEALKLSGVALHDARKLIEDKCEVRGHGERYSAREMHGELLYKLDSALAKIQTILKP